MKMSEIALQEKELLRQFFLSRAAAGVDIRSIFVGHAATLGSLAAACSNNEAHLNTTLDTLTLTMRHNALMDSKVAGHG
jgi:hypothetical protein